MIMTHAAQRFVTPCFADTVGNAVATELFDRTQESEISHINLADSADLLVIAPATADVIAKRRLDSLRICCRRWRSPVRLRL